MPCITAHTGASCARLEKPPDIVTGGQQEETASAGQNRGNPFKELHSCPVVSAQWVVSGAPWEFRQKLVMRTVSGEDRGPGRRENH